jgi:uncharacterized protein YgiM (DUF1202 family)
MTSKKGKVINTYRSAYPDPLIIKTGEVLSVEERESEWAGWTWCVNKNGKAGWVPERYLEFSGDSCKALHDYDATELSVAVGEVLTVLNEESGWAWCENKNGRTGWVPADCIEIMN